MSERFLVKVYLIAKPLPVLSTLILCSLPSEPQPVTRLRLSLPAPTLDRPRLRFKPPAQTQACLTTELGLYQVTLSLYSNSLYLHSICK